MRIIEGERIDLIEPFPASMVPRLVNWYFRYRTFIQTDETPASPEALEAAMLASLSAPNVRTFGVVDKTGVTGFRHEAPMVGAIFFEHINSYNGYFHAASPKRAWGSGLIDDAGLLLIDTLFNEEPSLVRVSAAVVKRNRQACGLARRVGLKQDGFFEHAVAQDGEPQDVIHFGLTRKDWQQKWEASQNTSPQSQE